MLIEKTQEQLAAGDIVALRLISGEEIVGKITYIHDKTIIITKPILVQLQMMSPTQAGVGFAPYTAAVDEDSKFVFSTDNLIHAPMRPTKQIKANYIKATTGIELVSPGTLIK